MKRIIGMHIQHRRRYEGSHGDVWSTTWAADGHLYAACDDGSGFKRTDQRNLAINRLVGSSIDDLVGETINPMSDFGAASETGPDGATWKANGLTCVDGTLYLSVSRHRYGTSPYFIQQTWDASILSSTDAGRTWSARPSLGEAMFPDRFFSTPFFIQYGQDGKEGRDGGETYVYAVSSDGVWNNGSAMTLGRVRRDLLPQLDGRTWEFFAGLDTQGQPRWSAHLQQAAYLLRVPGQVSMTGIHYLSPLGLYLMPQWHYLYPEDTSGHDWISIVTKSPTRLVFYTAPVPWGPWTLVHAEQFDEGWYNPTVPASFIRDDGSGFVLCAAGLGGVGQPHYSLNLFEVELDLAE